LHINGTSLGSEILVALIQGKVELFRDYWNLLSQS